MSDQQIINVGTAPNDGDGDSLRNAFVKTNTNFTTLFGTAGITGIASGTSNLSIPVANGNVTISATGVPNVLVVGPLGATITGNLNVTNTANIGNIVVPGTIVATGTIQGIGDITGVAITASGNLTSGAYIFGDGGFLSNVTAVSNLAVTQISNSTTIMAVASAGGNITTQVNGVANILTLTTTSVTTGKLISATGNVTAGNLITAGQVSATGNVTGGNINSNRLYGTSLNITSVGGLTLAPSGNIIMSNTIINGVAYPLQDNDAASKIYVDTVAQGLHIHAPANVATMADLQSTFSGSTVTYAQPNGSGNGVGATLQIAGNTFSALDGVSLSSDMRILVKNQSNAVTNGIYVYSNSTAFTRSSDADLSADLSGGDFIFVQSGSTQADSGWVMTSDQPVMGVGNIIWAQFSGAGSYTAGSGLTLTGSTFSVNVDNVTTAISSGNVIVKASANLTTPNIGAATGTSLSVSGNITGGNILGGANVNATTHTGTTVSVTGNITGGNILGGANVNATTHTGTTVSVTGNITGNYILGNGALLTGVITSVANINSGTSNVTVVSSGGNVSVGVGGTGNVAVFATTGEYITGVISATGNITGGNILGGANVNATTHTGTTVSVTGNITGGNLSGTSIVGTLTTAAQTNITSVGTLTALAVTGNITGGNLSVSTGTITGGNIVNGNGNGIGNIGSSTVYFNTVFAKATSAQYADVAELYVADAQYAPGTVLEFGGANEVTIAEDSTIRIAGVVSTDPAYLMNAGQAGEYIVPVALLGRVPCRVKGNIRKGDMLISGGDGYARPAQYQPLVGSVIGKALENHTGGDGVITVVVGRI